MCFKDEGYDDKQTHFSASTHNLLLRTLLAALPRFIPRCTSCSILFSISQWYPVLDVASADPERAHALQVRKLWVPPSMNFSGSTGCTCMPCGARFAVYSHVDRRVRLTTNCTVRSILRAVISRSACDEAVQSPRITFWSCTKRTDRV